MNSIETRNLVRRKNRQISPRQAPGELAILQAFLNTENRKAAVDELETPYDLDAWLSSRSLLPPGTKVTIEDFERALDVRRGLQALVMAHSGYAELDTSAIERLNKASAGARVEVRFDDDGALRFVAASTSFADALGRLLAMVAAARLEGEWTRLKACANDRCRAAFYDSKRTGKWCSDRCGGLMRARTYDRRRRKLKGSE